MDRIMIVEDESIVALNLKHTLKRLGYDVVGMAHTSDDALELARQTRPDIVLMDIELGVGGDGIDTATRLSQFGRPAVIFLTTCSDAATRVRAQETQPYGFLQKPFSERDLHATLKMTLKRHRSDTRLADSESRLGLALDCAGMGMWDFNFETERVECPADTSLMIGGGHAIDEARVGFMKRVVPEDRAAVSDAHTEAVLHGKAKPVKFRRVQACGAPVWLRLQGRRHVEPGISSQLLGVAEDVTARHRKEVDVQQAATVFDSCNEVIFIADATLRLLSVSPAFVKATGHAAVDVVGRKIDSWLVRSVPGQPALDLNAALELHGHWRGELLALRSGGDVFPAWLSITGLPDVRGDERRVVGILSDIGASRRAEAELIRLAHHDPLTGLPNRLLATARLEQAIVRARRNQWRTAVLMVDLDHLKHINDGLGHAAGDEFLRSVATRLHACVRSDDTVARLGGDRFAIILENVAGAREVAIVGAKVLKSLLEPLTIAGAQIRSGASVGISTFPNDAPDAPDLLRAADTALQVARKKGRNRCVFFKERMSDNVMKRAASLRDLRRGLAANELVVYYQPQVSLVDMRLIGMEALVRWQHPTRGLLGADDVIPVAEESGLIVEVGAYVLNAVCRQIRQWQDRGLACPTVAVNISVQQLQAHSFATQVGKLLAGWGVAADRLELELTESTLQHESICMPAMQALEQLGVALAIDDFGTGYSSLGSLRHLPVGRCKIDQCFIDEIASHDSDAVIAGAVIDLGHRLGMRITAEGVETEAQLDVLRKLGCDDVQGFLFARPMSASDASALLRIRAARDCKAPHYFHRPQPIATIEPPHPLLTSVALPLLVSEY